MEEIRIKSGFAWTALAVLLMGLGGCAGLQKNTGESRLLADLQDGGYVIFFRHAATDHSSSDVDKVNLENCDKQRNLSNRGRQQAKNIGYSFQQLAIPVGEVISSYYCRCVDTANIAFHKATATMDITSIQGVTPEVRSQRIANLRSLLNKPPQDKTNTVIVAHKWMFKEAGGHLLEEGEAAIFKPVEGGTAQFVKRVKPDEWMMLSKSGSKRAVGSGIY